MSLNDVIVNAIVTAREKYPALGAGKSWDDSYISVETRSMTLGPGGVAMVKMSVVKTFGTVESVI
jgi:hypothetical protein